MSELRRCPFCGSNLARLRVMRGTCNTRPYSIVCDWCGAEASHRASPEKAAAAWNRRASGWVSVEEDKPKDTKAVNVIWVNHQPPSYYSDIKDKPQVGTAHYYGPKDCWFWESPVCEDYLNEYGRSDMDIIDEAIEITHWMSLPDPPEE